MGQGLNRVMLLGNLGADPELRVTQGGQPVLSMRLATTESYLDKDRVRRERTDWHNITVWGKRGEALAKIVTKGSSLFIEGSIRTSSYDDRDGNKRYKTEIIATNVILSGGKGRGGEHESSEDDPAAAAGGGTGEARAAAPATAPTTDPEVRFSPRKWEGPDFKGRSFSKCPPDFLDVLAESLAYSAANPQPGKEKYVASNRKDAEAARAWAAYLRQGGRGNGAGRSNGQSSNGGGRGYASAASTPGDGDYSGDGSGASYGGGAYDDDDIPF